MEKIYGNLVTTYGDNIEQQAFYDGMSKEDKKKFLKQYIVGLTYKRAEYKDYNIDEISQKIVDTISKEDFCELMRKLEDGVRFIVNRAASDRIVAAFNSIVSSNGKKSVKNAFMEKCDIPEDINPLISSCLSQTYKMLIDYDFLLAQQLFNKLFDKGLLTSDPRFKMVIDGIREQTGKLHNVDNETVVRIIRNGIAHMNYVDNATTTQCQDLQDLVNNLQVKISSKDGSDFIIISGRFIQMLSELMIKYLGGKMFAMNIPKEYNFLSDDYSRRMYLLKKCKEMTAEDSKLEQFEKDFVKLCIQQNTEHVLTEKGFSSLKTTIENPQFLIMQKIKNVSELIIKLNKTRNKTNQNEHDILQSLPTLSIVYLYEAISHLIDLELRNEYVDNNIDKGILTKAFNTPKKKSIKNRLRLLRNCLAHGHVLNYGYFYQFYDVDEKGVKTDLGKIDFQTIFTLTEDIENYVMKYYDNVLDEFKDKVSTSSNDDKKRGM